MLIGVDIGTTHLKAAAFDELGRRRALGTAPTPTIRLEGGGAEYDPEQIWHAVAGCLSQVVEQLNGEPIEAVGIASMAEAGLLIDSRGAPLGPAIAWFDPRSRPQSDRLERRREELYGRTGQVLQPKWGLMKLLWLKENRPSLLANAASWLNMMDWVLFRLTGRRVTDPSLAVRTMAYSMPERDWDRALLAELGLNPSLMPEILPSGGRAGGVSREAGEATGLLPGTPVCLGGHDHPCAAVAAGAIRPGTMLDSTGTAEAVIGAGDRLDLGPRALAASLSWTYLAGGAPALIGGQSASGGALEWFRNQVLDGVDYAGLLRIATEAGEGPSGIAFLPHLAGGGPPEVNPGSRAAWVGLTYGHSRSAMARAVLEGPVFEVRRMVEAMEELLTGDRTEPVRFNSIALTGGAARNPLWLQIRADILGRPIQVLEQEESTLLGAAILGGLGVGVYPDLDAAIATAAAAAGAADSGRLVQPQPAVAERYDRFFHQVYLPLTQALKTVYSGMAEYEGAGA